MVHEIFGWKPRAEKDLKSVKLGRLHGTVTQKKGQWFKQSLWAGGILFTNMLKKSERRQGEERAGL